MFNWFKKKELKEVREETKKGFESVKKDIISLSGWIKHLDSQKNIQQKDMDQIKQDISSVIEEIEGLKNIVSIVGNTNLNRSFKTNRSLLNKQTVVFPVQTAVQTAVQTLDLEKFSITERAIIWVLLNSELKLSYDDLAAMLGKEKSTIRGQINAIRQKGNGVIEEQIEQNGKKRVFIPEEIKEKMLKKAKVRVNSTKKYKKNEENE
jgi:biotin operon repressor